MLSTANPSTGMQPSSARRSAKAASSRRLLLFLFLSLLLYLLNVFRRRRLQHAHDDDGDYSQASCTFANTPIHPVEEGARSKAYTSMHATSEAGLDLVRAVQGFATTDLFHFHDKSPSVKPIMQALETPVRAVVMPLTEPASTVDRLTSVVQKHLSTLPSTLVWPQASAAPYHSSLHHASHHQNVVPLADVPGGRAAEIRGVAEAAAHACPLTLALARIVVTRGGAVVAGWRVNGGTEPATLRKSLASALPWSPDKQLYAPPDIVHTTVARVLSAPATSNTLARIRKAASAAESELCGLELTVRELWHVEESDVLALALGGRWSKHAIPLSGTTC